MANFDSVIFDFDGTVADTGEGIFECVRYAIRMEGLPQPSEEVLHTFIGPPMYESFHRVFPEIDDERVQQLIIHYRAKYSVDGIYKFRLYDGMEELLKTLHDSKVKVAIGSSKPEVFINHIIKNCGLKKYFDVSVGASPDYIESDKTSIVREAINRLGAADSSRILMIGDRKFDIVGAHNCNIKCAAVMFGYGNREEFEEYKAEYIVNNCDELKSIIL